MVVSAVATTGIYCRPGCSARPHPRNVSPYAAPIAAEAAGYRPCLRCRPDRHLRSVEVSGAPTPVAGAVALISSGFLDRFDESVLADRVGYSTRQMRRLFEQHVGATPDFVARSRRAHFARRLLDESDLTMPAVAAASGFGSARQMNRVIEQIFGFTPSALRAKRHRGDVLTVDGGLRLRLPFVVPLDRDAVLRHLRPRLTPGVESIEGSRYRRTLQVCGHPGVVEIDLGGNADHLEMTAHLPTFDSIIDEVARVRHMFGLDDDVIVANGVLADDPLLVPLIRARPGLRVVGGWDRFETAVRVIVGQQVSVAGATTTTGRLVRRHGTELDGAALGLTHLFPVPVELAKLAESDDDEGMPRRRAQTIGAIARAVIDGTVDLHSADPHELRRRLLGVPGIGPWTADVISMRAARDTDSFPAGDLGIRQAYANLCATDQLPGEGELAESSKRWRPHRALAAQHLWASLSANDEHRTEE